VVGRFLEHSRLFHFENDGRPEVYMGSGDWMDRNLRERVEAAIPIKDPAFVARIEDILAAYWADNVKARVMKADGSYVRAARGPGEAAFSAQEWLARRAESPDLPLPAGPRPFAARPRPAEAAPSGEDAAADPDSLQGAARGVPGPSRGAPSAPRGAEAA